MAGKLLIIGGREDKTRDKLILRCLADEVGSGKLVIATLASEEQKEMWEQYETTFRGLGVRHLYKLEVNSREEAKSEAKVKILRDADAIFFTGGDQLKITSLLGDSPIYERCHEIFREGGVIAGTSAGASVVCETMMVGGGSNGSHRLNEAVQLAAGFGFFKGAIVDQHFAERGRMGRLVAVVAQNPRMLGLGIDENTAILVKNQRTFTVLGDGAVYVVDGAPVSFTNISEGGFEETLSVFDLKLHLLTQGDTFDLSRRTPKAHPARELTEAIVPEAVRERVEAAADD